MPKFKEALNSGKFVVTAEVGPPKGANIEETLHNIDLIKEKTGSSDEFIYISAKLGLGIPELRKAIFRKFFKSYQRFKFSVKINDPKVNNISRWAIVLNRTYEGKVIKFDVLCDREKMLEFSYDKKET